MDVQSPRPVFLMTDFGHEDPYVGLVKAKILSRSPEASIIDLTHNIHPQDECETAFLLNYSYRDLPSGSIVVVVVDPAVGTDRRIIAAQTTDGIIVITPDTGIVNNLPLEKVYHVENKKLARKPISSTFHGRDWFGPVAGYLSNGGNLSNLGSKTRINSERQLIPETKISDNKIEGEILYVDHFGNLISNIHRKDIERLQKNCENLIVKISDHEIKGLSETYLSENGGSICALIGSFDRLEVAIPGGSAKKNVYAEKGSAVKINRES